jgi:nitrogen fixation NifU-like protein
MDVYAENILDHYRHPRGKKRLPSATVEHREENVVCGDALTLQLAINDHHNIDLGWEGTGCAISQASMSMLCEEIEGKPLAALEAFKKDDVYALLGVPIGLRRMKCALLSLHTLKNALRKARGEAPQGWLQTVEIEE